MTSPCYHKVLPRGKTETLREIELLQVASKYNFAPQLHEVFHYDNNSILCMERVRGQMLADIYGDHPDNIPGFVWEEINNILVTLFHNEGIEYIDITPYNFMQTTAGKIYIIDFGHAYYTPQNSNGVPSNWFLKDFLAGHNGWNPDFA